jgi:hypothetical protein
LIPTCFIFLPTSTSKTQIFRQTNNHLEGMFGHIKERVKIHRGLDKNRKKKAVKFLLKNWGRKVGF